MNTFILRENVLTDNLLFIASENKIFKGGYKAIIKEYFFQNCWSDKEVVKKFRKYETLEKYLAKNYKDFEIENIYTH
jgi:hypothetical protein